MTGKEALLELKGWIDYLLTTENIDPAVRRDAYQAISKLFEKIKTDFKYIEVLDILKEHFHIERDFEWQEGLWYIDMQESDFDFRSECTKEEWENSPQKKIKDWLYSRSD